MTKNNKKPSRIISFSPRGIAALPILAIVLVLALIVVGAVYFAGRDQSNGNPVNTANTTGPTYPTAANTPVNSNPSSPPVQHYNLRYTPSYSQTADDRLRYTNDLFGYSVMFPSGMRGLTSAGFSLTRTAQTDPVYGFSIKTEGGQEDLISITIYQLSQESAVLSYYQSELLGKSITIGGVAAEQALRAGVFDDFIIRREGYFVYIHSDQTDRKDSKSYQDYLAIRDSIATLDTDVTIYPVASL